MSLFLICNIATNMRSMKITLNSEHNDTREKNNLHDINRMQICIKSNEIRNGLWSISTALNKYYNKYLQLITVIDIPHSDIRLFRKSMYGARMKKHQLFQKILWKL
ncbi:Uncharacterized protein FWK35_00009795 [Aphis craccivora]|uniref:Uncharacterized protein n=1 Tax=Aphis craccivora TaxID=307492 RepID=A0A6G0ZGV0_APHCR|nr:Uncharacterized protein FWK35_00009795 [Aphis craccivora]